MRPTAAADAASQGSAADAPPGTPPRPLVLRVALSAVIDPESLPSDPAAAPPNPASGSSSAAAGLGDPAPAAAAPTAPAGSAPPSQAALPAKTPPKKRRADKGKRRDKDKRDTTPTGSSANLPPQPAAQGGPAETASSVWTVSLRQWLPGIQDKPAVSEPFGTDPEAPPLEHVCEYPIEMSPDLVPAMASAQLHVEVAAREVVVLTRGKREREIVKDERPLGAVAVDLSPFLADELTVTQRFVAGESGFVDPPPGVRELTVTCSLDEPLLTPELKARFVPMVVTVVQATDLPDRPMSYSQLAARCKPPYASFRFDGATHTTPGVPHGPTAAWNFRRVFMLGLAPRHEILDFLENDRLVVELHDRDRLQASAEDQSRDPFAVAKFSLWNAYRSGQPQTIKEPLMPAAGLSRTVEDYSMRPRPGLFLESGSQLKLRVHVLAKFPPLQDDGAFRRIIIVFQRRSQLLHDLLILVWRQNLRILNLEDAPEGSIESALLTQEQASDPSLDLITGFRIIDRKQHLLCLEGLGKASIQRIAAMLETHLGEAEGADVRVLWNPALAFPTRRYAAYGPVIRVIKLRDRLASLATSNSLFVRNLVTQDCCDGVVMLNSLQAANRMREVVRLRLFPSVAMLDAVDRKYGDVLVEADLAGNPTLSNAFLPTVATSSHRDSADDLAGPTQHSVPASAAPSEHEQAAGGATTPASRRRTALRKKAALDSFNNSMPALDRDTVDFIRENKRHVQTLSQANLRRARPVVDPADLGTHGQVFMYSNQRLNHVEVQKARLRRELAKDHQHYYTYSSEYFSASVPTGDDKDATLRADEPDRFLTPDGFHVPLRPENDARHPQAPSDSRIQELQEPWQEKRIARLGLRDDKPPPDGQPEFKIAAKAPGYFDTNPKYFQSVHLSGDGLEAEKEAAARAEAELWKSKVVVDSLHFSVDRANRSSVLDRYGSLLRDKPKKGILRRVHSDPPPPSMNLSEPFAERRQATFRTEADTGPGFSSMVSTKHASFTRSTKRTAPR